MTLGRGAMLSYSSKQKVNAKSTMEGVQEKGHDMTHMMVYQGKKSAILLEANSKISNSKRMKHIEAK